jgi:hypothetical protein
LIGMESDHRLLMRRTVLFGTPLLYLVLGLLHPNPDPGFGDDTGLFIGLHIAQLFLIAGLAYSLWLLVDGLESRAATIARALILPYVITYSAFDAVAGIAMGTFVREANAAPAADQAAAERLIDALREETWSGYLFYFLTALIWVAAVLAVVIALRKSAPRAALVLMGLGAAIFAVGHPQPTGPVGMALFLAGVVWLELRPLRAESPEAVSTQPT